jgi:hypothetical protein
MIEKRSVGGPTCAVKEGAVQKGLAHSIDALQIYESNPRRVLSS